MTRVRVTGEIRAAVQVPHPWTRDRSELIWKAQVKVETWEPVSGDEPPTLPDRVEITYPYHPKMGTKVRFTANHKGDKCLSNPRGIAEHHGSESNRGDPWRRIGG